MASRSDRSRILPALLERAYRLLLGVYPSDAFSNLRDGYWVAAFALPRAGESDASDRPEYEGRLKMDFPGAYVKNAGSLAPR